MSLKILILGVNGFIGSHLADRILAETDWELFGMDMASHQLTQHKDNPRFHFTEGDITLHKEWVEDQVKTCDVVLPLVAVATPATYVQDPLRVFELDFEANLPIVRHCVRYKKRVIFPSTSEVYGMCPDTEFDEYNSTLVQGPISKERWIYSCSKQLLDRVIFAYGTHQDLNYTLFRPFNWIGPRQDNIFNRKAGGSRVLTQFLSNILHGLPLQLVDGGTQRRCFTYIDDGISALMKIIANKDNCADQRIFNIGNPHNNLSVKELAEQLVEIAKQYPAFAEKAQHVEILVEDAKTYYGSGYQDVSARTPAIAEAKTYLDWEPQYTMSEALHKTLAYYQKQII